MRKKCENCGKEFEARQEHFKLCPNCFSARQHSANSFHKPSISSNELLPNYYDKDGVLLKEVFIDIPECLANAFFKDGLSVKQLRSFHTVILQARNKSFLNGIVSARPILYKLEPEIECQLKRKVIPQSFADFIKHHLKLAVKDIESLEGFFQHLDSIVCYFPHFKGG
jgi:CRISPR/Cas system CSM-associated protein Csm2 small subunit